MLNKKEEEEYIKNYNADEFEKFSLTTDLLILGISDYKTDNYRKLSQKTMSVYLVKRDNFPFKNCRALPGGFLDIKETLLSSAHNVLKNKTNLDDIYLEQLYTFDEVDRDPRMRILSTAYMALIDIKKASSDFQDNSNWFNVIWNDDKIILQNQKNTTETYNLDDNSCLSFDHAKIIKLGIDRLKNKIEYTNLAFRLLPEEFTLTELQHVYEAILGKKLLAPAFRRIIKPFVEKTGQIQEGLGHRPSAFYCLKK